MQETTRWCASALLPRGGVVDCVLNNRIAELFVRGSCAVDDIRRV